MAPVKSRSLLQICYIQDVGKWKASQPKPCSLHGWCEYDVCRLVEHDSELSGKMSTINVLKIGALGGDGIRNT
jgi:hypothetical protein